MIADQNSWNAFRRSRFFSTTCTGCFGHGNRSVPEKVRWISRASAVVSHSPYRFANPRE